MDRYKVLSTYLQSGIQNLLSSKRIVEAFGKYGHSTLKQLKKDFAWNSGPEIEINGAPGRDVNAVGHTKRGKNGNNIIELNSQIVQLLQNIAGANSKADAETKDAALLVVIYTLMHEEAHNGDERDGSPPRYDKGDPGVAFDTDIYGIAGPDGAKWEDIEMRSGLGDENYNELIIKGAKDIRKDKKKRGQQDDLPTLGGSSKDNSTSNMSWDDINEWIIKALDVNPKIDIKIN